MISANVPVFSKNEVGEFLQIALKASELAEQEILKCYESDLAIEWKSDLTPVTKADKNAEAVMRQFFAEEMPEAGMIGEEFGVETPEAAFQWILDPIDGTKSFIHGAPLFATLIALYYKNQPLVSVVRLPALNKCLYASANGGAFLNEKPVRCSAVSTFSESLVLSGSVNTLEDKGFANAFTQMRRAAKLYRGWGDAFGYYLVATSRAEVMFDPVVSLWDIAPFPLLFQEAGGVFTTVQGETSLFNAAGQPLHPIYEGYTGLASNSHLANQALAFFANT